MLSTKRNFFIFFALGIVFTGVVFFLYFMPSRPRTSGAGGSASAGKGNLYGSGGISRNATSSHFFALSGKDDKVLNYWLSDGRLYYFNSRGSLFTIDLGTFRRNQLVGVSFKNLIGIKVSPDKKKVILAWSKNGNERFSLFNLADKNIHSLPEETLSLSFSPDSGKIAIYYFDDKLNSPALEILNLDNWQSERIIALPIYNLSLDWFDEEKIALSESPTCSEFQGLAILSLKSKKFTFLPGGLGMEYKFSPSGGEILVSFEGSGASRVYSPEGKILANLGTLVIPCKCGFGENDNLLYCALPKSLPANVCLPDDYWQGKLNFGERIVSVSLKNLEERNVFEDNFSDISNITTVESGLVFLDRVTRGLYYLKLK